MSVPPLPQLDTLSPAPRQKLVVELLVRVSTLEEENQQLRAENARLKALPKKPKLAPGGMDKASEPDKRSQDQGGAPAAAQAAEWPAPPAGDHGAHPGH